MGKPNLGMKKFKSKEFDCFSTTLHLSLKDDDIMQNRMESGRLKLGAKPSTYNYPKQEKGRGIIRELQPELNIIRERLRTITTTSLEKGWELVEFEEAARNLVDTSKPLKLHNSRGTKIINQGENVLEFDLAGSGFEGFNQLQKGVKGKTKYIDKKDREKVWQETYGQKVKVKGKERKYVRMKSKVAGNLEKTRISMAGPLGINLFWCKKGVFNIGAYKIESLREYVLELGQNYIQKKLPACLEFEETCKQMRETGYSEAEINEYCAEWKKIQNYVPINIILKGHSRGGVAMSHGAMMLQYWINENLPMLKDLIKFETTQYDPVPGTIVGHDEKDEISLVGGSKEERENLAKKKMAPLNTDAKTTVVYSLHTQHDVFFTPQIVKGAKRIILSPLNHDVGLGDVDISQGQKHRAGYTYSKKDTLGRAETEVYRGSGINELEEGVFVADEDGVLTKLKTPEEARKFFTSVYLSKDRKGKDGNKKKIRNWQLDRHIAIVDAVSAWFANHQEPV